MLKCCLDIVTRTLQTSVSVWQGFRYILFTLETTAQINKFLSKQRVAPTKCPLRYCQKYSFPVVWGLVGWFGVRQGCLLLALIPDKCRSPRYSVLSAVLAYPLLSAEEERDEVVGVGPWQQSKQGEVVEQQHWGVRAEKEKFCSSLFLDGGQTPPYCGLCCPDSCAGWALVCAEWW